MPRKRESESSVDPSRYNSFAEVSDDWPEAIVEWDLHVAPVCKEIRILFRNLAGGLTVYIWTHEGIGLMCFWERGRWVTR